VCTGAISKRRRSKENSLRAANLFIHSQSKKDLEMNNPYAQGAVTAYRRVYAGAVLDGANPHGLVKMLMQGALDRLAAAKGCMLHGNPEKGRIISSVLAIVDELRRSLNFEAGGEIAQNLDGLYDYVQRRLLRGQLDSDTAALDEVRSLLQEIKYAWDAVPEVIGDLPRRAADV
jgi:flagellar protein FliS